MAGRGRPRPDQDEPPDPRVAPVPPMWAYVRRNATSIFRIYTLYEPLRVFLAAAAPAALAAAVIWVRFLWFFFSGEEGHIQSLILGSTLFVVAVQLAALGVLGDILAGSRVLQQRILERVRRVELHVGVAPSHYEPGEERVGEPATTGATPSAPPASRSGSRSRRSGGVAAPEVPTGNTYDKYGSSNPVVKRLMTGFHGALDEPGSARAARVRARRGLRRGRVDEEWAQRLGDGHWSASTSTTRSSAPSGTSAAAATSAPRRPRRSRSPTTSSTSPPPSRCWSTCPSRRRPWPRWPGGAPPPARVGAARAALARPQHGPGRLLALAREHARAREPLVQAVVRPPLAPRRGGGGAPLPLDHAACPRRIRRAMAGVPPSSRWGSAPPG